MKRILLALVSILLIAGCIQQTITPSDTTSQISKQDAVETVKNYYVIIGYLTPQEFDLETRDKIYVTEFSDSYRVYLTEDDETGYFDVYKSNGKLKCVKYPTSAGGKERFWCGKEILEQFPSVSDLKEIVQT